MEKIGRLVYNIQTKSYEIDHGQNVFESLYPEECFKVLLGNKWIKVKIHQDNNKEWFLSIKNLHGFKVKLDETTL